VGELGNIQSVFWPTSNGVEAGFQQFSEHSDLASNSSRRLTCDQMLKTTFDIQARDYERIERALNGEVGDIWRLRQDSLKRVVTIMQIPKSMFPHSDQNITLPNLLAIIQCKSPLTITQVMSYWSRAQALLLASSIEDGAKDVCYVVDGTRLRVDLFEDKPWICECKEDRREWKQLCSHLLAVGWFSNRMEQMVKLLPLHKQMRPLNSPEQLMLPEKGTTATKKAKAKRYFNRPRASTAKRPRPISNIRSSSIQGDDLAFDQDSSFHDESNEDSNSTNGTSSVNGNVVDSDDGKIVRDIEIGDFIFVDTADLPQTYVKCLEPRI